MSGGDGLSSIISGLSGLNTGSQNNKSSDSENTDTGFSDEIDNLFKDFVDETRNENNE